MREYYVYIMTNRWKTLYTGMTGNIVQRVRQHKEHVNEGFTTDYKMDRLAYYEKYTGVREAIAREKQIKGWLRIKKLQLIVSMNPEWRDLAEDWYKPVEELKLRGRAAKAEVLRCAQDDKRLRAAKRHRSFATLRMTSG